MGNTPLQACKNDGFEGIVKIKTEFNSERYMCFRKLFASVPVWDGGHTTMTNLTLLQVSGTGSAQIHIGVALILLVIMTLVLLKRV